jgi:hypothetical protein
MLLHGFPYLEANKMGKTPHMQVRKEAEKRAKERFDGGTSSLTISRINEMSEIGHMLEIAQMMGCWLCAYGYNPLLHPVTARDFAKAVADFCEDHSSDHRKCEEFLVGGPRQITYKDLGRAISNVCEKPLIFVTLPLIVYRFLVWLLGFLGCVSPMLRGISYSLKVLGVAMTTNTANDKFIFVGSDTIDEYLREHAAPGKLTWVQEKVFGPNYKENTLLDTMLPSPKNLARVFGFFAACDGLVALFKPNVVGLLQNVDVNGMTADRFLVLGTGVAATSIVVMTFISLQESNKAVERAISASIVLRLLLNVLLWYVGDFATVLDINLTMLHVFNSISVVALLTMMKNSSLLGAKVLSCMTAAIGLLHYMYPGVMAHSMGLFVTELSERTKQLSRQTSMYYLGNGIQMFALTCGIRPEKAVGLVSLTWFICSLDLHFVARISEVFDMSEASRAINMLFPVWAGLLSCGILWRSDRCKHD